MEFTIEKEALVQGLEFFDEIIDKKNVLPILGTVFISSVDERTVRFSATNLDLSLCCEVPGRVIQPGQMCVSASRLLNIVKSELDAPLTFHSLSGHQTEIRCGNLSLLVNAERVDAFPEFPKIRDQVCVVKTEVLSTLIDRTIFAVPTSPTRYCPNGARLEVDSTGISITATDGHRLAFINRKHNTSEHAHGSLDAQIPFKTLSLLKKSITNHPEVQISADNNYIRVDIHQRQLISSLLSEQFPDSEKVLSGPFRRTFTCENLKLRTVIRRVLQLADERSKAIRFHLEPGLLEVSSSNAAKERASETLEVQYFGEKFDLGFNADYLLDFMRQFGSTLIRVDFKDPGSAVQIAPLKDDGFDYRYIVMPMKI
jgi:DNA polymerase-3 subunit beta